ncbi:MAG: NAD(+)/NADH kinase [Bacteroidota bacterium]|nr:NAD(+)/NADH kinase [Bacteroidota bacterium]
MQQGGSKRNSKPVGIFPHSGKPGTGAVILSLAQFLRRKGVPVLVPTDTAGMIRTTGKGTASGLTTATPSEIARRSRFVVAIGGDGSMLAAAREVLPYGTPVLGINLGKLGFLADIDAEEAVPAVDAVLRGEYRIEKRMTLSGTVGKRCTCHALNDIVVNKTGTSRVIRIEAFVDDEFLATFLADGFIVSTPTGSTAYSLATGGPVVVPSSDVIILSPIAAHALTARPIIIPGGSRVRLHAFAEAGAVMVNADGEGIVMGATDVVLTVRRGARPVRLIKGVGWKYFEMLRKKLAWGQDRRFPDTFQLEDDTPSVKGCKP